MVLRVGLKVRLALDSLAAWDSSEFGERGGNLSPTAYG